MASRVAQEIKAKYESVLAESGPRLATFRARRDHYRNTACGMPGQTWSWMGTSSEAVRPSNRHALRVCFAHKAAVQIVGRFMGELPQSRVMPRQETEQERWRAQALEQVLWATYGWSDALVQFQSAAWHGSVLGAGVFRVGWDIGTKRPWFRSVRPENVLIKFATGDGSEWEYACYAAERSLNSVARKYGLDPGDLEPDRIEEGTGRRFVTVIDYWDDERHILTAGGRVLNGRDKEGEGVKNSYGWIPYILVRNWGPVEYAWGLSDQEFFEGLSEYYNSLLSQHADSIRLYSNPPVFARQTGHSASDILEIFRAGGVIASNKEKADLRVVQASGAPPEYQAQDQRMRLLLDAMSFAPPQGGERTSAAALQEMGVGTEALVALKKANWEVAQRLLNTRILQMVEKLAVGEVEFKGTLESGLRSRSFAMTLNDGESYPSKDELMEMADADGLSFDLTTEELMESVRAVSQELNYRKLVDGDYSTRIVWNNRTMKQDPQYQLMLLNRFSQGALSLRTLLEEVGIEDVEQEIQRIRQEAEEMPWLRPQVAEFMAKEREGLAGTGALEPPNPNRALEGGSGYDLMSRGLNGSEGTSRRAGSVMGAPHGGW